MTPYLEADGLSIHLGDAVKTLQAMPAESVDCAVTSPPFYGLRDYGTGRWDGGDPECEHKQPSGSRQGSSGVRADRSFTATRPYREECLLCGAKRVDEQIGLEDNLDDWLVRLVEVFREVRRVLRPWGVLLLECGDSYEAGTRVDRRPSRTLDRYSDHGYWSDASIGKRTSAGLKTKDLIGQPWMLAFALRADGWWLRHGYIWDKPNPLPESVDDRCTTAHSYVFHLAKSGDATFWTHRDRPGTLTQPEPDYVWVPRNAPTGEHEKGIGGWAAGEGPHDAVGFAQNGRGQSHHDAHAGQTEEYAESREPVEGWRRINLWDGHDYFWDKTAIAELASENTHARGKGSGVKQAGTAAGQGIRGNEDFGGSIREVLPTRNARSVWRIPTEPSGMGICRVCRHYWPRNAPATHCGKDVTAHYAAFPTELAEKAIKAATSERGICAECGAPWVRAVRKGDPELAANTWSPEGGGAYDLDVGGWDARPLGKEGSTLKYVRTTETVGWRPVCDCSYRCDVAACTGCRYCEERRTRAAEPVPSVVLDPFGGSGTTLLAARKLGRHALMVELSDDYAELAARRLAMPEAVERAAETAQESTQLLLL